MPSNIALYSPCAFCIPPHACIVCSVEEDRKEEETGKGLVVPLVACYVCGLLCLCSCYYSQHLCIIAPTMPCCVHSAVFIPVLTPFTPFYAALYTLPFLLPQTPAPLLCLYLPNTFPLYYLDPTPTSCLCVILTLPCDPLAACAVLLLGPYTHCPSSLTPCPHLPPHSSA